MSTEHPRILLAKAAPELFKALGELERLVEERSKTAGLTHGFTSLLRLRASQINGCSYCVRLHTRDALREQESSDRIGLVAAWRDCDYFTPKERAALALVEAMTLISVGQVPDALYAEVAAVLSPEEIIAIEWIGIAINTWNRLAISSRTPVHPSPPPPA